MLYKTSTVVCKYGRSVAIEQQKAEQLRKPSVFKRACGYRRRAAAKQARLIIGPDMAAAQDAVMMSNSR